MWPILKTIFNDSSSSEAKISLLNLFLLHNPQLDKDEDLPFIRDTIQNLVSSPITRNEGYFLLDAITNSNPNVYFQNWGPLIISKLKEPDNWESKSLTLQILKRMVLNFSANPSVQEAFQRFIPEIISLLLKFPKNSEVAIDSCKALTICMQCLPAIVGPFSDEIESFLMEHAGSVDFKTEEVTADCFAAIPICLESRMKPKPSYQEVWMNTFLKLLNTLQSLLNDFLKNCKVVGSSVNVEGMPLLPTPREDENNEHVLIIKRTKLFTSLCNCLSKMMSVHTDSNLDNLRVKVPAQELLKCMERISLVYDNIKENNPSENSFMSLNCPLMQISALSVLESLILNFTIIEQSGNIVAILNKIVLTTVSETKESWAWYVRSSTWKVADAWLKTYGPKGACYIVNSKFLIRELLKDIIPEQENGQTLEIRRKDTPKIIEPREESCRIALSVLYSVFIHGGPFMEKDFLNDVVCTVLKVACKVQQSSHPSRNFVLPYTNKNCRLKLYECLLHASLSDPTQTKYMKQAVNIFRFATKDPHLEVRTVCYSALHTFRYYIHPKKPLPEALTVGAAKAPPPEEESVQEGGWESGFNWNAQNESSQERSMDVSPPCQIESTYHNSLGSDSRRDMAPAQASPHYADGVSGTQCNGSGEPKHSSHSNADSESNDVKEYSVEDAEIADEEDIPSPQGPIIETLKPAQVQEDKSANNNREYPTDDMFSEEAESVSPQRMAENGVYAESEEEEENSEEDEEGSEEEEENHEGYGPQYPTSRYSPVSEENEHSAVREYYPEKKRPRMANEEEQSSGEEYEEVPPSKLLVQESAQEESENVHLATVHMIASNSPTVDEMCQDFVLAEPEEIR